MTQLRLESITLLRVNSRNKKDPGSGHEYQNNLLSEMSTWFDKMKNHYWYTLNDTQRENLLNIAEQYDAID